MSSWYFVPVNKFVLFIQVVELIGMKLLAVFPIVLLTSVESVIKKEDQLSITSNYERHL